MNIKTEARPSAQNWLYVSALKCMDCGKHAGLLEERKFRCPKCGGLYDVLHDRDPAIMAQVSGYLSRLNKRFGVSAPDFPEHCSDVWAFRELVMPGIPDKHVVTLGERVQIVPAGRNVREWLGVNDVFIALEGLTPTGSFKDFGGTVLASVAKAAGIKRLVCASTGDTSAMLAAYAAAGGMECVVLLPKGLVSMVQAVQPLAFGAKVLMLDTDFDGCMAIMQELVEVHGAYPGNSLNPARIEGHQVTTFKSWWHFGGELPEWIVAPVGNGSDVSSIGKGQRSLIDNGFAKRPARILGVQPEKSAPLTESWLRAWATDNNDLSSEWLAQYNTVKAGDTLATAARIGAPVSHKKVIREICYANGVMDVASDDEIVEAIRVCGSDGHFVCPQSGMALAGLRKQVQAGVVEWDDRVVVVSTAAGIKFPNVLDSVAASLMHEVTGASAERVVEFLK